MMLTDLIPMVERSYRVRPDARIGRWPGCRWAARRRSARPSSILDKFAYIGGFSGSSGGRGGFDPKTSGGGVFADAASFNKKVKVLFLGIGVGGRTWHEEFQRRSSRKPASRTSTTSRPARRTTWLTWRRCFKEFAPRLFR